MPIAKPVLFTIHGIYTDGPWQNGAASVLNPFFEHHPLKYVRYRRMAIVKLAGAWLTGLLLVVLGAVVWRLGYFNWWGAILYLSLFAILVSIAHVGSDKGIRKVMTALYVEMSEKCGIRPRPFVIAHSLGTYLLGRMLRHYEDWGCDTIILTGCVLRRTFPWALMSSQFHYVSNEVAGRDLVPLSAGVLGLTVEDMGCAGILGFKGEPQSVHNVSPTLEYPNCKGRQCDCSAHGRIASCTARIHNIRHRFLRHSDYFDGKNHAWRSWLPTLWGYDPVLYRRFIEACQQCDMLERNQALALDVDAAAQVLRTTCWGWTNGTLEAFAQRALSRELSGLNRAVPSDRFSQLVDVAIGVLWRNVSEAARESDRLSAQKYEVLEHLNPRTALKRSMAATLQLS